MANCAACKKELESVFGDTEYQFDNALWIGFFGGYSMFVESPDFVDGSAQILPSTHEVVICHECAHALCEQHPWIAEVIKPYHSHSHKVDFWKDNPDHEGWDSPNSK